MLPRQAAAGVVAFVLLNQAMLAANPKELSLRWNDLAPAVAGMRVSLALPDGVRIEGRVAAVEPEALRIRITKTSDPKAQPKGETSIPRTAVSMVQVERYGVRWRIACTAIGPIFVSAAAAGYASRAGPSGSALSALVGFSAAAVAGTAMAGYYLGKRADRQVTIIRIAPENRQ